MHRTFLALILFSALAAAQNLVTNRDIVTLAKAGFNEDFITDFIAMSHTRFDTSVNGLADLAKEGLTERLIRAMIAASSTTQPALPLQYVAPAPEIRKHKLAQPSAASMALTNNTPFYTTSSFFFGLWKKRTGVGASATAEEVIAPQLGLAYGPMRLSSPVMSPHYVLLK